LIAVVAQDVVCVGTFLAVREKAGPGRVVAIFGACVEDGVA
jgi:hypothetical protein